MFSGNRCQRTEKGGQASLESGLGVGQACTQRARTVGRVG